MTEKAAPAPRKQVNPTAAAIHYAASAEFWEDRAKALQNDLLMANTELEQIRAELLTLRNAESPKK